MLAAVNRSGLVFSHFLKAVIDFLSLHLNFTASYRLQSQCEELLLAGLAAVGTKNGFFTVTLVIMLTWLTFTGVHGRLEVIAHSPFKQQTQHSVLQQLSS